MTIYSIAARTTLLQFVTLAFAISTFLCGEAVDSAFCSDKTDGTYADSAALPAGSSYYTCLGGRLTSYIRCEEGQQYSQVAEACVALGCGGALECPPPSAVSEALTSREQMQLSFQGTGEMASPVAARKGQLKQEQEQEQKQGGERDGEQKGGGPARSGRPLHLRLLESVGRAILPVIGGHHPPGSGAAPLLFFLT
eukprot:jgi/Mesen1/1387/ME000013S00883